MKYKLLSVRGHKECNIGDYVQALASSQYLPSIDGFINRERLKDYKDEECKVIMNAWYMHDITQWPPSNKITPLFVSTHFNSSAIDGLLSDESISYLKKYAPIGCRDYYTTEHLKEKGIDAYFSACMTLTLGQKYKSEEKDDKCYFVDPSYKVDKGYFTLLKNFVFLIFNWPKIEKIAKKHPSKKGFFRKRMALVTFYLAYKKYFTEDTLLNAEYISQQNEEYKNNFPTDEDRLKEAERLVKLYSRAKLVVTSRIHCALPCLGLETPVIFTDLATKGQDDICRFDGIRDLFWVMDWKNGELVPEFKINNKFSINNVVKNKTTWKQYAENLVKRCKNFIND